MGSVGAVSEAAAPGASVEVSVIGFDHLVLVTPDVDRSLRFYVGSLGLQPEREQLWRGGLVPFPSVRVDATTVIDLVHGEMSVPLRDGGRGNLDHLCLVIAPTDLAALAASGRFEVTDGPATRWGAQGLATSLYVRDPDGNVVELRVYDR